MLEPAAEQALIGAAILGDGPAVEQLLLAHYAMLLRHVEQKLPPRANRHFGAEDILQLVFAQVYRDMPQFVPRGEGSFAAWLKKIADHRLIDELRRIGAGRKLQQMTLSNFANITSFQELMDAVCQDSYTPISAAGETETAQALQIAIAKLPEEQQEMIRARFLQEKSVEQIAQETGRTEAAVRGLIHRGKENLREAMGRSSRWQMNLYRRKNSPPS